MATIHNWGQLKATLSEIFKVCGAEESDSLSDRYLRVISLRAVLELEESIPQNLKNASPEKVVNYLGNNHSAIEISEAFSAATAKVIGPVFDLILPKLSTEQIEKISSIMEKLNPEKTHNHV